MNNKEQLDKAIDMITSFWNENASLRAENERLKGDGWIRVEDVLPDEGTEVNICISHSFTGTAIYESVGLICEFVNDSYDSFESSMVTHWRPLPNPPGL